MDVIRENRSKHTLWRLTDDNKAQNAVILAAEKELVHSVAPQGEPGVHPALKGRKDGRGAKGGAGDAGGFASLSTPRHRSASPRAPRFSAAMAAAADEAPMAAYRGLSAAADEAEERGTTPAAPPPEPTASPRRPRRRRRAAPSFERDLPGPPLEASGSVIDSDDEPTIWLSSLSYRKHGSS